mmetsp:Transcript_25092/g.33644  ORF Transcript_25092/g.33644 Transcript_25092/m.33644 type:complete len:114 (-) Transcript_25092:1559-1900(-)
MQIVFVAAHAKLGRLSDTLGCSGLPLCEQLEQDLILGRLLALGLARVRFEGLLFVRTDRVDGVFLFVDDHFLVVSELITAALVNGTIPFGGQNSKIALFVLFTLVAESAIVPG